ncbi:hypothetical protein HDG34_000943 [Paraburkholderia sp. HC6.4b]|nr:hypothetical protein [Paraburkholderia sp. HC6.4b]MBB5449417.1 hypothetical protein [Paraburkholderia sp. Kb1A]
MTPDNAALTRRFTDSADGVLWLTSSTSPGQVQELDELGRELHRNKPLLPVVTRSDEYEEDEVDGELVKCLCNKSAPRRALQEHITALVFVSFGSCTRAGSRPRIRLAQTGLLRSSIAFPIRTEHALQVSRNGLEGSGQVTSRMDRHRAAH